MSETGDSSNNYENGGRISGEQIKALQILIQAAHVAQKKGAFELPEAELVSQAVKAFVVKREGEGETGANNESSTTNETTPKVI